MRPAMTRPKSEREVIIHTPIREENPCTAFLGLSLAFTTVGFLFYYKIAGDIGWNIGKPIRFEGAGQGLVRARQCTTPSGRVSPPRPVLSSPRMQSPRNKGKLASKDSIVRKELAERLKASEDGCKTPKPEKKKRWRNVQRRPRRRPRRGS